jgi:cell wall-associated NlpC family hydrolase
MATRKQIVAAARCYVGCRYRHQGRNRRGIDCAGLAVLVSRDCGLPVLDMAGYGTTPDGTLIAQLDAQANPIPRSQAQPGDIFLMRFNGDPQHLAIVADHPQGGLSIIHSYAGARKVVEHRVDEQWAARIVAAYSFRGVEA